MFQEPKRGGLHLPKIGTAVYRRVGGSPPAGRFSRARSSRIIFGALGGEFALG
jgi:hypothetical protein